MKNKLSCFHLILLILFFLLFPSPVLSQNPWHLPEWRYRQIFSLSQFKPNTIVFLNFPQTSQIFQLAKQDGSDIRITDQHGNNLPFLIKNWSQKFKIGNLVIKINDYSQKIFIYFGNPNAPPYQKPDQVYSIFQQFSEIPISWNINPRENAIINNASFITSWTIPLFKEEETLNIGPGIILEDQTIIAASVNTGEIKKSQDMGQTWKNISINYPQSPQDPFEKSLSNHKDFISRFFFKDSRGNFYTSFDGGNGIFKSHDKGITWRKVLNFTPFFDCCPPPPYGCWNYVDGCDSNCTNCSSGKTYQERIEEAIQNNPLSYEVACAVKKDNSENCIKRFCSSRCKTSRSMTEFFDRPGTLLAASYTGGDSHEVSIERGSHIFKSENWGETWTKVWSDPETTPIKQGRHVHFVAADPFHPGRAYAAIGDGAYKAKIIRSDDYGNSWRIIKREENPTSPHSPYWQPTAIAFDENCRYFGGDNEQDPIIHKSCGNEEKFEIVFRSRNQVGYFYWANSDSQKNIYFGFFSHITLASSLYNINEAMSFIVGKAKDEELWQIISLLGKYQYPAERERSGTIWSSNFVNNISLISTFEKKPYLLKVEKNENKNYLEIKPNTEVSINLPNLSQTESLLIEFLMALRGSENSVPTTQIPIFDIISFLSSDGAIQINPFVKADDRYPNLWYVYTNQNNNTFVPFSLNLWHNFQIRINLRNKNWLLCLPDYKYCSPVFSLQNPSKNLARIRFKSNNFHPYLLANFTVGDYVPNENIPILEKEESAPSPTSNPCPLSLLGNLNCDSEGKINDADLDILINYFGLVNPTIPVGFASPDLNSDQKIDERDLSILLRKWRN